MTLNWSAGADSSQMKRDIAAMAKVTMIVKKQHIDR